MRDDYLQVMSIVTAASNLSSELVHFTVIDDIRRGMISTMNIMVIEESAIEISSSWEARA
jgi:hypothetical protein